MMIDLDEIERRANAATPGREWERRIEESSCGECGEYSEYVQYFCAGPYCETEDAARKDAAFIAHARTDVPALVARVRELEAECERTRIFGSRKFAELRAADVEQMREYGLSYEGVRKVLHEYNDGEISFGKLMDLIRAAARAMAEEMQK
jgi:hypothetical protein